MSELVEGWTDFNVAMAGATAALAGLLIVAMSVNLKAIVASRSLPDRMASALAMLVVALAATALGLAPDQPIWAYGIEVLAATAFAVFFEVRAIRSIAHETVTTIRQRVAKSLAGAVPVLAYVAAGALLVAGAVGPGLWLVAVGAILAIASAILHSWIVLIEVLR